MDAGTLPYLVERYPLLITKLNIPRLDTELLARPNLLERLDLAVNRPLVLITAPAGWGKTTLVAAWVRQAGRPVGWISLDEGDNDLSRFWLHLIAALQQIRPGVGEVSLSWFYSQEAPPVETRLAILINDLALADEIFIVVLDDVHFIRSPVIHDSLTFFIEHLPSNVHLILTSRANLPLPLARQRAGRQLVEFESQDLRFSFIECNEFLQKIMGLQLAPEQIAAITDRTEGWVAGLQLVALALQGMPSTQDRVGVEDAIPGIRAGSRYILDYLSEEVLSRQEPEIQEFLLKTSVLERLSGDLCEAVTGIGESQRILERLGQIKLFIVALDNEQRWFRYHHLFRDFLSGLLARSWPDKVADLHRLAAQWYAAEGLPHDAVPHAMAAEDYELAGRIILEHGSELWQREEFPTLRSWLGALPLDLRQRYPDLCLYHAWSLFRTLGLDEMSSMVARAEALLAGGAPPLGNFSASELGGILDTMKTAISVLQQDFQATPEIARSALARLPAEQGDWRYAALLGVGLAHYFRNDTQAAVLAFEEAFQSAVALKRGTFYGKAFAISWLARMDMVQGNLHRAKKSYQEALILAAGPTGVLLPAAAWALTGLGELCYQWNELELAEKYFNDSLALSTHITPSTAPPYIPLVRQALARGDVHSAEAYFEKAVELAGKANIHTFERQVRLCQPWLAMQRGDIAALQQWIQDQGLDLERPTPPGEAEYVMAARILIAVQDYPRALKLIERLLEMAEAGGRSGVAIELLILQSLALQGQGKPDSALGVLQRAIDSASREGYVRLFVEEGEAMARLLRLFVARFGTSEYAARLLGAFTKKVETTELLNERENEVLHLLANGLSNAEIAKALYITVGTVKWHTNHIYAKLQVKSRGQAVARARELQLISLSTST